MISHHFTDRDWCVSARVDSDPKTDQPHHPMSTVPPPAQTAYRQVVRSAGRASRRQRRRDRRVAEWAANRDHGGDGAAGCAGVASPVLVDPDRRRESRPAPRCRPGRDAVDATQVADPFHVSWLANTAVDECRRRVQNETFGHRDRNQIRSTELDCCSRGGPNGSPTSVVND